MQLDNPIFKVYLCIMLRINDNKYSFGVEAQSASSVAGHQIPIKPAARKKVAGFFYSQASLGDWRAFIRNLPFQVMRQTAFKYDKQSFITFLCDLSFLGLKIWSKNRQFRKLIWTGFVTTLKK